MKHQHLYSVFESPEGLAIREPADTSATDLVKENARSYDRAVFAVLSPHIYIPDIVTLAKVLKMCRMALSVDKVVAYPE